MSTNLLESLLFRPPKKTYDQDAYPGELCCLNGVTCLAFASKDPSCCNIVIYCHANSNDVGMCYKYLDAMRSRLNVHVIAVEYPGYGFKKDQLPTEHGVNMAVYQVYDYVRGSLHWPAENITVVGRSIGTGPAVHLASTEEVGALVLISAFSSIMDIVDKHFPIIGRLVVGEQNHWESKKTIRKVKCPVLFLHGDKDKFIPPQQTSVLFEQCTSDRKQFLYLEGYGHNRLDFGIIFRLMREFMKNQGMQVKIATATDHSGDGQIPEIELFKFNDTLLAAAAEKVYIPSLHLRPNASDEKEKEVPPANVADPNMRQKMLRKYTPDIDTLIQMLGEDAVDTAFALRSSPAAAPKFDLDLTSGSVPATPGGERHSPARARPPVPAPTKMTALVPKDIGVQKQHYLGGLRRSPSAPLLHTDGVTGAGSPTATPPEPEPRELRAPVREPRAPVPKVPLPKLCRAPSLGNLDGAGGGGAAEARPVYMLRRAPSLGDLEGAGGRAAAAAAVEGFSEGAFPVGLSLRRAPSSSVLEEEAASGLDLRWVVLDTVEQGGGVGAAAAGKGEEKGEGVAPVGTVEGDGEGGGAPTGGYFFYVDEEPEQFVVDEVVEF